MKITLCGSLAFFEEMEKVRKDLEALGHEVKSPPLMVPDGKGGEISVYDRYKQSKAAGIGDDAIWDMCEGAMRNHFDKVVWCDAVLVVNEEKNDIPGYIGANTLLEVGVGFHFKKPLYLMHQIPEISYQEEILGMKPIVIDSDLSKLDTVKDSKSLIMAKEYLGKEVDLVFDRPLGSEHPKHGFRYEVNYGMVPGTMAPDGHELDAYYLGVDRPLEKASGTCIAIAHRKNDDDDNIIVVPSGMTMTNDQIMSAIEFQEKWFDTVIVRG